MDIHLDGIIEPGGLSAAWLRGKLPQGDTPVTLRVNSPGGSVHEGIAIMNTLRGYPGRVTAVVDGLAASAASFLIIGGADHIVMNQHSEMMIHAPWMSLEGDGPTLVKAASDLERLGSTIAKIYAEKAGGTPEHWAALMAAETWFTADEAVTAGLADQVQAGTKPKAHAFAMLSAFKYRSRAEAPTPQLETNMEFNQQQWSDLCAALDLDPASAGADEAVSAVKSLTEIEEGTVNMSEVTYNELMATAKAGMEARAAQQATERANEVDTWIKEGRLNPAYRSTAVAAMARDPKVGRELYGSAPKNTIPVQAIGHDQDPDIHDDTTKAGWVR